ncbi:hypothetical protein SAMN06265349_1011039 [Flavobacterium resistens]|uniref:Uncharacterized protein n=1 Tax=Flavobacterium resistens TaxID=443612 RepID=A0A521BGJ8_9FLAO|nr:hypothetical protein [Flavobacterium resistens]MRX67356.1 hypothetical protein [Flavobacterium resistens]SMO46215.1 hypothetical protein SAMN06265349_1011039 [Flavobacterium resistens]
MKKHIFLFAVVAILLTACNNKENDITVSEDGIVKPKAPKAEGFKRLLFIGNNHTEYFVSTPTLFQELCNANNQSVSVQQLITMGVPLDKVYDTNKTEANQNFSNRDKDGNYYDYVILQESTPIALSALEKYRSNLKMLVEKIHVNSPDVAIYIYEGMSPVSYTDSKFNEYHEEMRKNALLAMVFIKNAGLLRVGDAIKDAYDGKKGYNYLLNNKDNLRYEQNNTFLVLNDGGFLQATLLYATIFDKRPIIPKKLILSTGINDDDCMRRQEVAKAISNPKALEEIAFSNR